MRKALTWVRIGTPMLVLTAIFSVTSGTHVFWYKAKANNYSITDCKPGPCLPDDAIIHEGAIASGESNNRGDMVSFGKQSDGYYFVTYFWSEDLSQLAATNISSAVLQAEFNNEITQGERFCVEGSIRLKCGVVDFSGNIAALGGIEGLPEMMEWRDEDNPLSPSMGFDAKSKAMAAESIKMIKAKPGRKTQFERSPIDGEFFEIDLTEQVQWILNNKGQFAIVLVSLPVSSGKEGRLKGFSVETGAGVTKRKYSRKKVWTIDGNTCHLVVVPKQGNLLKMAVPMSKPEPFPAGLVKWRSPLPFSMMRADSVNIELEIDRRMADLIDRIVFLSYYIRKGQENFFMNEIGEDSTFPYGVTLKDSLMPDQSYGSVKIYYDIVPKNAGSKLTSAMLKGSMLTGIDRTPQLSKKTLKSKFTKNGRITIDGDLSDWPKAFDGRFTNNDNEIRIKSAWDQLNLYFAFQISDRNVRSHYFPNAKEVKSMYAQDEMEVLIDGHHKHLEYMREQDKQFLVSAAGMVYEGIRDSGRVRENLKPNCKAKTRVLGTLNKEDGNDTGYVIEMAIPFSELGTKPRERMVLGIDFLNTDLDSLKTSDLHGVWSGNEHNAFHNPSEWGNLLLVKGAGKMMVSAIGVAFLCLLIAGGVVLLRIRSRRQLLANDAPVKDEIKKAKEFMHQNYQDSSLSLKSTAQSCNISHYYLSSLFKQEVGIGFNQYLIDLRIKKAEEMLKTSLKRISEIAFEVGFGSNEHFVRTFKKHKGHSPTEFRKSVHLQR